MMDTFAIAGDFGESSGLADLPKLPQIGIRANLGAAIARLYPKLPSQTPLLDQAARMMAYSPFEKSIRNTQRREKALYGALAPLSIVNTIGKLPLTGITSSIAGLDKLLWPTEADRRRGRFRCIEGGVVAWKRPKGV